MKIIPFVLATICFTAQADELLFTTFSIHSHRDYTANGMQYNDVNLGFGYKLDNGFFAGDYLNSYNRNSFLVGKEFMFTKHFGAVAYGATGYGPEMGHKVIGAGGFEYKIPLGDWSANLVGIPPIGKTSGVINLNFSYDLKGEK